MNYLDTSRRVTNIGDGTVALPVNPSLPVNCFDCYKGALMDNIVLKNKYFQSSPHQTIISTLLVNNTH